LAIAKSLALQLLETNVGDKALFEKLSSAYRASTMSSASPEIEAAMWAALEAGLNTADATEDRLMIVIDGLDEVDEHSQAILQKFETLNKSHRCLQTIVLARVMATTNTMTQIVDIKMDHTHKDMEHVVKHALHGLTSLKDQNEFNREKVVEQIVHHAQGNFLWAILTVALLKKEQTHATFMKVLHEMPKTIHDLVKKLVGTFDLQKPETKLLIQWLLVAKRPLTLAEINCLYRVDMQKKALVDRKTDIREDVSRACGLLVNIQDGVVAYRHNAIRAYLRKTMAEKTFILPWLDAQEDLTMRLLMYCKLSLTKPFQPVFEIPGTFDIGEIFRTHALLEYSARYWMLHFKESSLHPSADSLRVSQELKAIFPSSTELAVLEWKCWDFQTSVSEALIWHNLALRIRQAIFTEKHESVLQTLITCGSFHKRLLNTKEAGTCFYRASRIGREIMQKYNAVTISCTSTFLAVTETITFTARTEIVTQKEEMLKYIIVASKHQHGKTNEIVVRYYRLLAELYIDIKEELHAEEVWKELREIIILRHGKGSEEEKEISKNLVIVLKKDQKKEDLVEYESSILETITAIEVWDIRRIKMTFELAVSYEARGELFLAEELYIQLWRRLTEHCHQTHNHYGVEIHISVIDVALEYIRFLRRHQRHQEAAGVLICIWNEYEDYEFEDETIFLRLKIVGELMRAVSLLAIAVSVFKKCWSWFKFHGKHEHEMSCEVLISETAEEIITTTTTTTTSTTTETIIREIFESTLSKMIVTKETITICKNLISLHMKLEQWNEAIEVTERSLTLIWKMIISGSGTLALPRSFDSESIDIAIGLAICHYRLHHFHEAEEIYVRIYRACRMSCHIEDERLVKSYKTLVKFYEDHRHWHRMIDIYQELLIEYRAHLGASHTLTIKTLYILGSLCSEHGHGHALGYYEEIVTVLNGKKHVCHKDAKDAMIILCRVYYEDGHYLKLKDVCKVLWESWTHRHKEYKFEAEFIEVLYQRYIYVLEYHLHCEYEIIRTLTVQYRDTCLKVFGVLSILTIRAMIELAKVCMRSEKHIHEAISIYEELITKTTTTTSTTVTTSTITISTTTMATIKESLSKAYVKMCSHGSVSATTIEKAVKVLFERFEYLKVKPGCTHSETLIVFRELLLLYKKLKTQEAHTTILRMLNNISFEIITKEKNSVALHEAAITLGGIFMSLDLAEHGIEIIAEVRKQVITGKSITTKKFGFDIHGKASKVSYIFTVTLERVLHSSLSISYSEIMSEMLIETTLYEHYNMCLKSETDLTVVLTHAARLRTFLVARKRDDQISTLETQTFEIFSKKWGASMGKTAAKEIVKIYFVGLIIQLGVDGREIKFGTAASIASVVTVTDLLKQGSFKTAFEVAQGSFEFLNQQRAYHHLENIPHFFKLSGLLAGREISFKDKTPEPELHQSMLKFSQTIIREVFKVLKESNIDIIRLKPEDLDNIVALLGAQQNYADLEVRCHSPNDHLDTNPPLQWLLKSLWLSREVHKTWTRATIISIGRLLATVYSLTGKHTAAIKICEDICYNLRRVWGSLHPESLKMEELLSQVYTAAGHYREAMGVHEDVLCLIVEGDDGDDRTADVVEPAVARRHLDLLKASFLRLKGWDKSASNYHELVRDLLSMREHKAHAAFKDVGPAEKWSLKDDPGSVGMLVAPPEWRFVGSSGVNGAGSGGAGASLGVAGSRPRMGLKRASSNWGLGFLHDLLHGGHDDEEMEEETLRMATRQAYYQNGNWNGVRNGKA
jgi:tetratricopeptide (TPR) repeat protein